MLMWLYLTWMAKSSVCTIASGQSGLNWRSTSSPFCFLPMTNSPFSLNSILPWFTFCFLPVVLKVCPWCSCICFLIALTLGSFPCSICTLVLPSTMVENGYHSSLFASTSMLFAILTNHGFGFVLYLIWICLAVTRFNEDAGVTAPKSYTILISGFSLSLSFSLIVSSMFFCCPLASSCRLIAPLNISFTSKWTSFSKIWSSQFGMIFPMLFE